jgi:pyruvate dehydrogenase E1 component
VPTCLSYDPAYVYELAVIVQDGLRRMYAEGEDHFYYITMYNEDYAMPAMPEGVRGGIVRGIYRFRAAAAAAGEKPSGKKAKGGAGSVVQLLASGPIVNEALRAQEILAEKYGVAADVWSVTSWTELRRDALEAERWNRLHPAEAARTPYVVSALGDANGPYIAATDYMKALPDALAPWLGSRLVTLGTDGFGRSDNREHLRRHFENNAASIAAAALSKLARDGAFDKAKAQAAFAELGVETEGTNPALL